MAFDPNSLDPDKIRELIVEGLVIDKRAGTIKADRIETSSDPEIAKHELASLAAMAETKELSPLELADIAFRARFEANIPMPKPKPGKSCTLAEGIEAFLKFKGGLAKGTLTTYTYRLNMLASLIGGSDKMLHEITEEDCIDVAEEYRSMAPHATQRSKDKQGVGIISASTVKDTLTLWQSFFDWAVSTKRYAGTNPIKGIPRPSENNEDTGAEPFRPDELKKIFQHENFKAMKRPHQYWGPLLGLFTGARSNELAQLRLDDFAIDGDIRYIKIRHNPAAGTRTKNRPSNRDLPLHPMLWTIGLQDYLDDMKEIGADRLFPNLPADKHGKREKYLSRDFNENLLADLGIWQARVKIFHSFRDTMMSKLSASGKVHPDHIDDWMGHARQGVGAKHYNAPLPLPLQVENILPLLDFGLDFSEFRYERGCWNEWLSKHMVP